MTTESLQVSEARKTDDLKVFEFGTRVEVIITQEPQIDARHRG